MQTVTATDAKQRFGECLELVQREPVYIQKQGRTVAIMISPTDFQALKRRAPRKAGFGKDLILYPEHIMDPVEGFEEYS